MERPFSIEKVVLLLSFAVCDLKFEAKPRWAVLSFCFFFFGQQRKMYIDMGRGYPH
jgi:hypothetical protein